MAKNLKNAKNVDPKFGILLIDEDLLKSKIYTIRGVKVMLDADLAEIYGYSTKRFNEQVKYNIDRFDEDFRFQLTKEECEIVTRSEIPTLKSGAGHNIKYLPYAFTEQGVYMLMTVLKGDLAIRQSKALIRLFKKMKDYILAENGRFLENPVVAMLDARITQNSKDIAVVSDRVDALSVEVRDMREGMGKMNLSLQKVMEYFDDPSTHKEFVFLDGERLEADVAYSKIYQMASKTLVIVDDYVNVKTLDLLQAAPQNAKVIIVSDERGKSKLTETLLEDFRKTRPDVEISKLPSNGFSHDRFILLDCGMPSEKLYQSGGSSKDGGKRLSRIDEVERSRHKDKIVRRIAKVLEGNAE